MYVRAKFARYLKKHDQRNLNNTLGECQAGHFYFFTSYKQKLTCIKLNFAQPFHHAVLTTGHKEIFRSIRHFDSENIFLLRIVCGYFTRSVVQNQRWGSRVVFNESCNEVRKITSRFTLLYYSLKNSSLEIP